MGCWLAYTKMSSNRAAIKAPQRVELMTRINNVASMKLNSGRIFALESTLLKYVYALVSMQSMVR